MAAAPDACRIGPLPPPVAPVPNSVTLSRRYSGDAQLLRLHTTREGAQPHRLRASSWWRRRESETSVLGIANSLGRPAEPLTRPAETVRLNARIADVVVL